MAAAPSTPYPDILGIPTQNMGVAPGLSQARQWVGTGCCGWPPQRVPVPLFPITSTPGWSLAGRGSPGYARAGPFVNRLVSQAQVAALLPSAQGHGQVGCHAPWLGGTTPHPTSLSAAHPKGVVWVGNIYPTLGCPPPWGAPHPGVSPHPQLPPTPGCPPATPSCPPHPQTISPGWGPC